MSRSREHDYQPSIRKPFGELPNGYCKRSPSPNPSPYYDELILSPASLSSFSDDHPDYAVSPLLPTGPITTSQPGFPTYEQYKRIQAAYLANLAPRKRAKALITQAMFDQIWEVLWQPDVTRIGTPQFRFWVRKMFRLVNVQGGGSRIGQAWRASHNNPENGTNSKGKARKSEDFPPVVLHENRPVAIMEQMYEVLCYCHGSAQHGGRDKTCAVVREHYSWVPKELVAQFVKVCPTCLLKRSGNPGLAVTTERTSGGVLKEEVEERTEVGKGVEGFGSIGRPRTGPAESFDSSILKAGIPHRSNGENMLPGVPRPPGGSICNMRGDNPFPSAGQLKTVNSTQNNGTGLLAINHPVPCSLSATPQLQPNVARPFNTLHYYGNLTGGDNIWNGAGLPPLREVLMDSAIRNHSCALRKPSFLNDTHESLPPTLQRLLIMGPIHHKDPAAVPTRCVNPAMLSASRMEELPTNENEITPPLRTSTPVLRLVNHRHTGIPSAGPAIPDPWNGTRTVDEVWSMEPPMSLHGPDDIDTYRSRIPSRGWM